MRQLQLGFGERGPSGFGGLQAASERCSCLGRATTGLLERTPQPPQVHARDVLRALADRVIELVEYVQTSGFDRPGVEERVLSAAVDTLKQRFQKLDLLVLAEHSSTHQREMLCLKRAAARF